MRNALRVPWLTVALLASGYPAAGAAPQTGDAACDLTLTSPAFARGEAIPSRYTHDGEDVSPPLVIAGAPQRTVTFALIMDDPDAPGSTWVHWVVWNIPAGAREIPTGELPEGAVEGRNSWGRNAYGGPAPPSGTHRYYFKLFALDAPLDLPPRTDASALRRAMERHVLAAVELMGTYRRR